MTTRMATFENFDALLTLFFTNYQIQSLFVHFQNQYTHLAS